MPKRRILFGLGMGMICSCLALYLVYTNSLSDAEPGNGALYASGAALTDDEIIEMAIQLGLTFANENEIENEIESEINNENEVLYLAGAEDDSENTSDWPDWNEEADEVEYETEDYDTWQAEPVEEYYWQPNIEDDDPDEPLYNQQNLESNSELISEPNLDEPVFVQSQPESVWVYVPRGSCATRIAGILKDANVIGSVPDFVRILEQRDYTRRMSAGGFVLDPNLDYSTLADIMAGRGR